MLYANQRNEVKSTQDASLLVEINGITLHDVPLYVAGCQPCEARTLIRVDSAGFRWPVLSGEETGLTRQNRLCPIFCFKCSIYKVCRKHQPREHELFEMVDDVYTFEEAFKEAPVVNREERCNNQGLILNTRGTDD